MARRKNVYSKVKEITEIYLLEHIGERAVSGWPRFDEEPGRWIVAIMCETSQGVLPAGKIELNKKLELVYATPRDAMVRVVEEQLRRLPHLVFADVDELKAKGIDVLTV